MGCSPPDWYYEKAAERARRERELERNKRVDTAIRAVKEMTPEEKAIFRKELGLEA